MMALRAYDACQLRHVIISSLKPQRGKVIPSSRMTSLHRA
jgi:hypothetical protein